MLYVLVSTRTGRIASEPRSYLAANDLAYSLNSKLGFRAYVVRPA